MPLAISKLEQESKTDFPFFSNYIPCPAKKILQLELSLLGQFIFQCALVGYPVTELLSFIGYIFRRNERMTMLFYEFAQQEKPSIPRRIFFIPLPSRKRLKQFLATDWQVIFSDSLVAEPGTKEVTIACTIFSGDITVAFTLDVSFELLKPNVPSTLFGVP